MQLVGLYMPLHSVLGCAYIYATQETIADIQAPDTRSQSQTAWFVSLITFSRPGLIYHSPMIP